VADRPTGPGNAVITVGGVPAAHTVTAAMLAATKILFILNVFMWLLPAEMVRKKVESVIPVSKTHGTPRSTN